jgi:hypothetical protein
MEAPCTARNFLYVKKRAIASATAITLGITTPAIIPAEGLEEVEVKVLELSPVPEELFDGLLNWS